MVEFRFSCNVFGVDEGFAEWCRRAESLGYDTLLAADHLGVPAPFSVVVAAAQATSRLRVGTLVLNAPFWNPALLAREIATADILTGGRLEVGLGSGHMRWEFDEAGIPWEPFDARADRLVDTIDELTRLFAADGYPQQQAQRELMGNPVLRPVQRRGFGGYGPPLIVGGTGDRILSIAGRSADIVSIAGTFHVKGRPPGTLRLATAAEAAERVAYARAQAGDRAVEWHALTQIVIVTDDRRSAAAKVLEQHGRFMAPDELLETPFVLIGSVDELAAQIIANRDRYGFTYYTVHAPYLEAFAPVISRVHELTRA
jgi:probable F420-dependent oxidoreductase